MTNCLLWCEKANICIFLNKFSCCNQNKPVENYSTGIDARNVEVAILLGILKEFMHVEIHKINFKRDHRRELPEIFVERVLQPDYLYPLIRFR